MSKVQLMTNAKRETTSFNSLEPFLQKQLRKKCYDFGIELAKNVGFDMRDMVNGTAPFFARELSYFLPQILMQRFPEFTFRLYTEILTAPIYSINVVFNIQDYTGEADFKTSRANDFDFADTNLTEEIVDILQTGTAITFAFVERKAAEAISNPAAYPQASSLIRAKMYALIRMTEAKKNKLFFEGSAVDSVYGILNNPDIPSYNVGAAWTTVTTDQMLTDIINCYNAVPSQSLNVFTPNVLSMSSIQYNYVNAKARSLYSDFTVLKWAEENLDGIEKIISDPFLNGKGPGGTGMMIAIHKDQLNSNMVISADLVAEPPQSEGQLLVQPYISRMTPFTVLQQQSLVRVGGI